MTCFFNEESSVETVNERMGDEVNPRLKALMTSLVAHLHAFAKDVNLTQDEWDFAIDFLTKTGQISSVERQEVILLSDVPGALHAGGRHEQPSACRRHRKHRVGSLPC